MDDGSPITRIIDATAIVSDLNADWLRNRLTLSFMGQAQPARLTITPYGLFAADFFELADMLMVAGGVE